MFLALDIGNSSVKAGLFNNEQLTEFNTIVSPESLISYLKKKNITRAAVSSVVPPLTRDLLKKLKNELNISPYRISKNSAFNINIDYKTPETLGIDRLCSAEGAFYLFKRSGQYKNYNKYFFILTADFGTATTINVIEYPGRFTGGLISPGIRMMFNSLKEKTAQLPLVKPENFKSTIGSDTRSSIASGVINAAAGMVERTAGYIKNELKGNEILIFITGGNSHVILSHLKVKFIHEPALVLHGIRAVYEKNKISF